MRRIFNFAVFCKILNEISYSLATHFELTDSNLTGDVLEEVRCSPISCALKCKINPLCQYSGLMVRQNEEICLLVGVPVHEPGSLYDHVDEFTKLSLLTPGDGKTSSNPGFSCHQIKKDYPEATSGIYWLKLSKPITAYCDMMVDQGGWLLVGRVDVKSEHIDTSLLTFSSDENSLSLVTTANVLLDGTALKKLQVYTRFTQLRIFCSKGLKILHLKTSQSQKGYDVIDYVTMKRDTCPSAIGAFHQMVDDVSVISQKLYETGNYKDGHVGFCRHDNLKIIDPNRRLYNHILFLSQVAQITLLDARKECDDHISDLGYQQTGLWEFYVR